MPKNKIFPGQDAAQVLQRIFLGAQKASKKNKSQEASTDASCKKNKKIACKRFTGPLANR